MLNMVLPLSRFGVYGGNADADTGAGNVTIQNTAKPSAAPSTTTIARLRSVKCLFISASLRASFRGADRSRFIRDRHLNDQVGNSRLGRREPGMTKGEPSARTPRPCLAQTFVQLFLRR